MTINEKIKALREAKRLSQYDMAEALNIGQSTYLQIEKGNTELTVKRLIQIADILGTTPSELLGGNNSNQEIELLKAEIEVLKEDLKRERKTIDNFNKFIDKISESAIATLGLSIAAMVADPEGTKKKLEEYKKENPEMFNSKSQEDVKPPVSGLFGDALFIPSKDKE